MLLRVQMVEMEEPENLPHASDDGELSQNAIICIGIHAHMGTTPTNRSLYRGSVTHYK